MGQTFFFNYNTLEVICNNDVTKLVKQNCVVIQRKKIGEEISISLDLLHYYDSFFSNTGAQSTLSRHGGV